MSRESPYRPPRSAIEEATRPGVEPPSVGYLIGGLLQLGAGVAIVISSLGTAVPNILGMFLVFLGFRAVVKYRVRARRARSTGRYRLSARL
jgi:hypothetical protein